MTSALTFKCGGEDPSKINTVQLFFLPSCSLCKETKGRLMIDVTEARRGGGGALASTERLNILMSTEGRSWEPPDMILTWLDSVMLTGHRQHYRIVGEWESTSQTFRHFEAATFSANNTSSAPRWCTPSLNIRDCAVLIRNMTHGFKANFSPDGSSACFSLWKLSG